jgi:hypothetical protein
MLFMNNFYFSSLIDFFVQISETIGVVWPSQAKPSPHLLSAVGVEISNPRKPAGGGECEKHGAKVLKFLSKLLSRIATQDGAILSFGEF